MRAAEHRVQVSVNALFMGTILVEPHVREKYFERILVGKAVDLEIRGRFLKYR